MEGIGSYNSGLDILEATELRLGPPGTEETPQRTSARVNKRALDATSNELVGVGGREVVPVAKVRVVGWPPVRHHRRKNSFQGRKKEDVEGGIYVKVSMDGAPYLRKIDLNVHKGYTDLRGALQDMFKCFSLGELEGNSGSDYVIAYEDKDGDLMLVGDVPWGMFISSCKRLRIMKVSDTRGLDTNQ